MGPYPSNFGQARVWTKNWASVAKSHNPYGLGLWGCCWVSCVNICVYVEALAISVV